MTEKPNYVIQQGAHRWPLSNSINPESCLKCETGHLKYNSETFLYFYSVKHLGYLIPSLCIYSLTHFLKVGGNK